MAKVYVVTSGHYSDYCIKAVFSDKIEVLKFVQAYNENETNDYNHACVEEYELDVCVDKTKQGLVLYRVGIRMNGDVYTVGVSEEDSGVRFYPRFGDHAKNPPLAATFDVWAKTKKHAIKIANERRAQLIATEQWGKE